MLKIGLTGGIGCGKTTVSNLFSDKHIPIIDADTIAHALVEPGKPALAQIASVFGATILKDGTTLDRQALREIVFSDTDKKQQLEAIMHPLIYTQMQLQLNVLESAAYTILSIPLLLETKMQHFVDRILVVDCPVEVQRARLKVRDQLTDARIDSIINSQFTREARNKRANDIIDNSGSISTLALQIKKLHNLYLSLSEHQEKPSL